MVLVSLGKPIRAELVFSNSFDRSANASKRRIIWLFCSDRGEEVPDTFPIVLQPDSVQDSPVVQIAQAARPQEIRQVLYDLLGLVAEPETGPARCCRHISPF
jgi:hypothetical protein